MKNSRSRIGRTRLILILLCIVLAAAENRNYLPKQARVELSEPLSGRKLYLLHAGAWLNPKKNLVGRLTVEYADGRTKEFRIRRRKKRGPDLERLQQQLPGFAVRLAVRPR